jgi:hypothetical protein
MNRPNLPLSLSLSLPLNLKSQIRDPVPQVQGTNAFAKAKESSP